MAEQATLSVLVVDDSMAIREAIARTFARRGIHVTTASNGQEGLEAIRQHRFDAVITDLNMPERGGLWLWQAAVELKPDLRGRFVLITSQPTPEPRTMELFVQSERFVLKPFSLESLWDQVQGIFRRDGYGPQDYPKGAA